MSTGWVTIACAFAFAGFLYLARHLLAADDAPLTRDDQATVTWVQGLRTDTPGPASAPYPGAPEGGGGDRNTSPSSPAAPAAGPGARPPWEQECHPVTGHTEGVWGDVTGHLDYAPAPPLADVFASMDGA